MSYWQEVRAWLKRHRDCEICKSWHKAETKILLVFVPSLITQTVIMFITFTFNIINLVPIIIPIIIITALIWFILEGYNDYRHKIYKHQNETGFPRLLKKKFVRS